MLSLLQATLRSLLGLKAQNSTDICGTISTPKGIIFKLGNNIRLNLPDTHFKSFLHFKSLVIHFYVKSCLSLTVSYLHIPFSIRDHRAIPVRRIITVCGHIVSLLLRVRDAVFIVNVRVFMAITIPVAFGFSITVVDLCISITIRFVFQFLAAVS